MQFLCKIRWANTKIPLGLADLARVGQPKVADSACESARGYQKVVSVHTARAGPFRFFAQGSGSPLRVRMSSVSRFYTRRLLDLNTCMTVKINDNKNA